MCEWGVADPWTWAATVGNSWRATEVAEAQFEIVACMLPACDGKVSPPSPLIHTSTVAPCTFPPPHCPPAHPRPAQQMQLIHACPHPCRTLRPTGSRSSRWGGCADGCEALVVVLPGPGPPIHSSTSNVCSCSCWTTRTAWLAMPSLAPGTTWTCWRVRQEGQVLWGDACDNTYAAGADAGLVTLLWPEGICAEHEGHLFDQ